MHFLDLFWHLAGFALPALSMALGMAAFSRAVWRSGGAHRLPLAAQLAAHVLAGLAVLLAGLALGGGQDGRMFTYAALVAVAATLQAALIRAPGKR